MFQHILVPTDGSSMSDAAVSHAARLAREVGARLTLFYAEPDPLASLAAAGLSSIGSTHELQERLDEGARHVLDAAEALVSAQGLACERRMSTGAAPWQLIIDAAEREGCDLIVMASHGRSGLGRLLLGSQCEQVLHHCKRPVLVHR